MFAKGRQLGATLQVRPLHWLGWAVFVLVCTVGVAIMILPYVWAFSMSFGEIGQFFELVPRWLPRRISLDNYAFALREAPIFLFAWNSLKVAIAVTAGQLLTCSMAGYAFARLRFPGRELIFFILLASMMIPGQVTLIPVFALMKGLGLMGTHAALIVPGLTSVFGVFLLRQFFAAIPSELEDAAKIDGASQWLIYWKIMLPLAGPGLSALGIITFIGSWNSFFWPLIMLQKKELFTLPLGLMLLRGSYMAIDVSAVMAGVAMATLPVLVVFLLAQRYIVEGLVTSGIKG